MKTIPEALKDLYVAMGGDAEDVANLTVTPDVIEALADVYEGGGGVSTFEATFTATPVVVEGEPTGEFTWDCDKTYAEITEAFESGKILRCHGVVTGLGVESYLTSYAISNSIISFIGIGYMNNSVVYLQAGIENDDSVFGMITPLETAQS